MKNIQNYQVFTKIYEVSTIFLAYRWFVCNIETKITATDHQYQSLQSKKKKKTYKFISALFSLSYIWYIYVYRDIFSQMGWHQLLSRNSVPTKHIWHLHTA